MIKFLFKGILNDRSRSVLPIIVVSIGVALTVLLTCYIEGMLVESVNTNANFNTGHVKVATKAFIKEESSLSAELALLDVDSLIKGLELSYPEMLWEERIRFGALIDFPDEKGETKIQGPVSGWSIDLFSPNSKEPERFNLHESVISGSVPVKPGEALISHHFAEKFGIEIGEQFTLFGTTMDNSMAFYNFIVSGTISFGVAAIDRGSLIIDISDARSALRMENAATEILGFFRDGDYDNSRAKTTANNYNKNVDLDEDDDFASVMVKLKDQGGMADYLDLAGVMRIIFVFAFIFAMSVVLWNTGLLGGLRRYTEFGLRLAMGEDKGHIYRTLIYEGLLIGAIGSIIGTLIGMTASYYLQEVGLHYGDALQGSSMMFPSTLRAKIVPAAWYIGFVPGVIAMLLGNAISGRGIYKRETAQLFKEMEV